VVRLLRRAQEPRTTKGCRVHPESRGLVPRPVGTGTSVRGVVPVGETPMTSVTFRAVYPELPAWGHLFSIRTVILASAHSASTRHPSGCDLMQHRLHQACGDACRPCVCANSFVVRNLRESATAIACSAVRESWWAIAFSRSRPPIMGFTLPIAKILYGLKINDPRLAILDRPRRNVHRCHRGFPDGNNSTYGKVLSQTGRGTRPRDSGCTRHPFVVRGS